MEAGGGGWMEEARMTTAMDIDAALDIRLFGTT